MSVFDTVLVTTDLSETSRHAFPVAIEIAEKFESRLVAVHVVESRLPPFVDEFTVVPVDEVVGVQLRRATEEMEKFVAPYTASGVPIERIVVPGTPHVDIVRLAEERRVGLIVMATHGRGFISHALYGSTTERVLRRAHCPVLAVRTASS
jgi:nucleotide-binding universal stress UspA family protein